MTGISRDISVGHPLTVHVEFTSSGIIIDNSMASEPVVPVVDMSDPQQAAGDSESTVCSALDTATLTTLPVSEPCGVTCSEPMPSGTHTTATKRISVVEILPLPKSTYNCTARSKTYCSSFRDHYRITVQNVPEE